MENTGQLIKSCEFYLANISCISKFKMPITPKCGEVDVAECLSVLSFQQEVWAEGAEWINIGINSRRPLQCCTSHRRHLSIFILEYGQGAECGKVQLHHPGQKKPFPVFLNLVKLSRESALPVPRNAKALSPPRAVRR